MPGDFVKDDLATFLDSDELGDVATYEGNTFDVQFFNEYEVAGLFGIEVESASPQIIAKDSDIPNIAHGSRIVVGKGSSIADDSFQDSADTMFVNTDNGQFDKSGQMEYKVIGIQPDGTGLTTLILSKD